MQEVLDDVVWEESFDVVTDAIKDLVEVHLEKAASYDIIMDMCTEIIEQEGPDIVSTVLVPLQLPPYTTKMRHSVTFTTAIYGTTKVHHTVKYTNIYYYVIP